MKPRAGISTFLDYSRDADSVIRALDIAILWEGSSGKDFDAFGYSLAC